MMSILTQIIASMDSSAFFSAFWAQLLATLIVVLIGSVLIPPIVRWGQRTKLKFHDSGSRRKTRFEFSQAQNGEWEITLDLSVGNNGTKTIERFYWEMYIVDLDVSMDLEQTPPFPTYFTTSEKIAKGIRHRLGYIQMPIFPLDSIHFPHELKIRIKERRPVKIYYQFRSDFGESPIWSWIAISLGKFNWLKSLTIT